MTPLPPGLRVALDRTVREGPRGTLIGGAPRRALRLSPAGRRALRSLEQGTAVTPSALALGRRLTDAGIAHPRPGPRDRPTNVTVVIPVRDRPAELDRCLAALDPATDVVVVDDGSRDGGVVAATAARHGARVVRRRVSGGPGAARNTALAVVDTELVAFLDSDCAPSRGWLPALVGHFDDPLVAAVAPRVRPLRRARPGIVDRYLASRSPLDMGPGEAGVEPGGPVSYVPTAALLVRRSALGEGFDTELRYGEDVDLVWRLRAAGARVRYDPAVAVDHAEPTTLRRMLARRFRYGTSAAPLAQRHPGRLAPAVLRPWPTLTALLLLTRRPAAAALVATWQSMLLGERVRHLGVPRRAGARWFGEATLQAALSLARFAAALALAPAVSLAWRARRTRVLALLTLPALDEWRRRERRLDPLRFTAMTLIDDAAYGAGVWWGSIRARTLAPLVPALGVRGMPAGISGVRNAFRRAASTVPRWSGGLPPEALVSRTKIRDPPIVVSPTNKGSTGDVR